jgi:hypothetical protein
MFSVDSGSLSLPLRNVKAIVTVNIIVERRDINLAVIVMHRLVYLNGNPNDVVLS